MALNYRECAGNIYNALGKNENLIRAEHCATRLRVIVKDMGDVNVEKLEETEGVQGVVKGNDQLQIIIGAGTVNKVYHEFRRIARLTEHTERKEERRKNISELPGRMIRVVGNVFIPILPAVITAGLLMGIIEAIGKCVPGFAKSDLYNWIDLVANTGVTYLPVLVALSATRLFGGNLYLGGVIGLLLMHKNLLTSWSAAATPAMVNYWDVLGVHIRRVNYQGHVIPVIIGIWVMCKIEKWMHKHMPEMADLFITPPVTILVTAFLIMGMIGPVFVKMENWILDITRFTLRLPLGIGAFLCGAAYPLTVIFGTHHMFSVLETGMLAENGKNIWIAVSSSANFAMSMACLAVFFRAKNKKTKAVALPASMSAALGITEPAIFGINLRYIRPLVCGMIGAAFGAAVGAMMGVYATTYGVTSLLGFLITMDCTREYCLMLLIAGGTAFILTGIFWRETVTSEEDRNIIYAPASGEVISQEQIPDETFAMGLLGTGVGILPSQKDILAPFDGTVIMTTQTGHAVAVKNAQGVKLMIHVGIDTVELEGNGFQLHVTDGELVKKGQKLMTVDLKLLKEKGYNSVTSIFVTNTKEMKEVIPIAKEKIKAGEPLIRVESNVN